MGSSSRKGFELAQFGILILVLSFVGVPLVQFLSGDPFSERWAVLNFAILGVGIAVLIGLPWLRARPIRLLRIAQLSNDPEARCLVVAQVNENCRPGALLLLTANREGILVSSSSSEPVTLSWDEITGVKAVTCPRKDLKAIEIEAPQLDGNFRFFPMNASGTSIVRPWDVPACVSQIARARDS